MTYATANESSTTRGGAAVWDIFPANVTDTLRIFLRESTNSNIDDPILRQKVYITAPQLQTLREEYHIVPWRIYQNPGDAVFIPAGCAHQVRHVFGKSLIVGV
jgi:[histone H3]-dimethyl-L-lysine9 demethylase